MAERTTLGPQRRTSTDALDNEYAVFIVRAVFMAALAAPQEPTMQSPNQTITREGTDIATVDTATVVLIHNRESFETKIRGGASNKLRPIKVGPFAGGE